MFVTLIEDKLRKFKSSEAFSPSKKLFNNEF